MAYRPHLFDKNKGRPLHAFFEDLDDRYVLSGPFLVTHARFLTPLVALRTRQQRTHHTTQREKQSKQYLMSLREGQELVALQVRSLDFGVRGSRSSP
jgi:hypothetical protein